MKSEYNVTFKSNIELIKSKCFSEFEHNNAGKTFKARKGFLGFYFINNSEEFPRGYREIFFSKIEEIKPEKPKTSQAVNDLKSKCSSLHEENENLRSELERQFEIVAELRKSVHTQQHRIKLLNIDKANLFEIVKKLSN